MLITLGGRPVQDALEERRNLAQLGYPAPANFDRANSLVNPLGEQAARGWFLLLRQDLLAIGLNGLLTLGLADDFGNSISVPNLVITREPACLTPSGSSTDPLACYLVEVSDSRWRCHNPYYSIPCEKQYNVRAPGWGGAYYASSLNSGSSWTWTTLLEDLWSTLSPLGSWPGLPAGFSPDGLPERYRFLGVSAWQALCQVLDKLGLAVAWQATAGTYSIVQRGATDATTAGILSAAGGRLILDRQLPAVVRGRVPAKVRVHFHRVQEHAGSEPATAQDSTQFITSNVYTVDVAGSAAQIAGAEPGSLVPLWDDLPALYDPAGTLLNSSALATRAANRAAAYYASIQGTGGGRLQQVYAGLVAVYPGSMLSAVAFRQDQQALTDPDGEGGGLLTEVVRLPVTRLRISEGGLVEDASEESSALHPPDLRVREPVWPDLLQVVRVTSTTTTAGLYPAVVEGYNSDTSAWLDRETVWVLPANSESLGTGRYLCRLAGSYSSSPLYATVNPNTTGTFNNATFTGTTNFTGTVDLDSGATFYTLAGSTWVYRDGSAPQFGDGGSGGGLTVLFGSPNTWIFQSFTYIWNNLAEWDINGTGPVIAAVLWEQCAAWFWCAVPLPQWTGNQIELALTGVTYPNGKVIFEVTQDTTGTIYLLESIVPINVKGSPGPQYIGLKNASTKPFIIQSNASGGGVVTTHTIQTPYPNGGSTTAQLTVNPEDTVWLWYDPYINNPQWFVVGLTSIFTGRGTSHSPGLVPDPGTGGADTDYLARDGSWKTIPAAGGNANAISKDYTGPTVTTPATTVVFDVTDTNGLHGSWRLKNTGAATISWKITGTDMSGTSNTSTGTLTGGSSFGWAADTLTLATVLFAPWKEIKFEVWDTGTHTTYDVWLALVGTPTGY